MGLDNQLLCGTACVGIITLVVAIDTKKTVAQESGLSDLNDGRGPLKKLSDLRDRWENLTKKDSLSAEECDFFARDLSKLKIDADNIYGDRAKAHPSDPLKYEFDTGTGGLFARVERRRALVPDKTTVVEYVPPPSGIPQRTDATKTKFEQDKPDWPAMPEPKPANFNQTAEHLDAMLDDYAEDTGDMVQTTDKREESAFVTQNDPLNAPENAENGEDAKAKAVMAAGLSTDIPPPQGVIQVEEREPEINNSFNTIVDPPREPAPTDKPPAKPEPPSHDEVLAKAQSAALLTNPPNFNSTGEVQFGDEQSETEIARLKKAIAAEQDPLQEADMKNKLNEMLRGQSDRSPAEVKFNDLIAAYLGKVEMYDRKLAQGYQEKYMVKILQYTKAMEKMADRIPSQRMKKLYKDSLAEAKAVCDKNKTKYNVKKTRRTESPTGLRNPKRQKVGGESALAAQGRSTGTGEPSRQKRKTSPFEQ